MVLLTVVLGGTIILTSILGVVSISQNTKSLIFGFQSVMILLILAQAVISIQGIFHVTSHKVKKLEGETLFYHLLPGWPWTEALVLFGEQRLGRVAKVFQMLRDPWSGRLGGGQALIFFPSSSIFFRQVPDSCCSTQGTDDCQDLHGKGCLSALSTWYNQFFYKYCFYPHCPKCSILIVLHSVIVIIVLIFIITSLGTAKNIMLT